MPDGSSSLCAPDETRRKSRENGDGREGDATAGASSSWAALSRLRLREGASMAGGCAVDAGGAGGGHGMAFCYMEFTFSQVRPTRF